MSAYYNQEVNEVLHQFKTDQQQGLNSAEARKRLQEFGYNQLKTKNKKSFLRMFLEQFKSFMILVLLVAALVSGIVGIMEGEGLMDTYIIMGILIVNALIGAYQEKKAESSLEALKNLSSPLAKVIRDAETKEIPSTHLVPGDIILLETGNIVPADIRLIEAVNLKIQESAMTGESVPVNKISEAIQGEAALGDRLNMAFSSGIVSYGRGLGVVVASGMQTEVGHIARMLDQTEDTGTPMKRRLEHLGKILGITALLICTLIFVVGILYGNNIMHMFMTAVSLAVAAIPEGLPAISTLVLAIGVQRLVKQNAIIRNLPSVETLGSATVICSDKTGTLTQNKMTVVQLFSNFGYTSVQDKAQEAKGTPSLLTPEELLLIQGAVLCNDSQLRLDEKAEISLMGDPTETALVDLGLAFGLDKNQLDKDFPRIEELPFESERKKMSVLNQLPDQSFRVFVKGGLDEVLSGCTQIMEKGRLRKISPEDLEGINQANTEMAASALRVLAVACKDYRQKPGAVDVNELEKGLSFIGMTGMIDPARPEVIEAVAKCNTAGIRTVMITGDHKITAMAIAREIGIFRDGDLAITGNELAKIPDEEFEAQVKNYSVYARVAPEHKVRIVKAWQKQDEIVAMTGDGVNDAPALKQADIGAAMGIVGTDVAKGAADMVLTDDNFATIVAAVQEGRRIYDNIIKAILFLLSCNIGEIFLLLVTAVLNLGTPLLPIHILWINLVTDSMPALALSVDPAEKNVMNRPPKNSKRGFMTKGMIWRMLYQGVMVGALPLVAYLVGLKDGGENLGQTMAFATLIFAQLVHVRNLHSNAKSSFSFNPLSNKPLIGAVLASAGMALLVLLIPPFRTAFNLVEMDSAHWLLVILLSFVTTLIVELFKLFRINGKD
ncbi:MAG: calcium-translocating P-type ATPase, PMCA-type [Bacteroidales bacterium]|jgi:Ca2+-transporting ATPase|nr:calcium-translocating P-type ATPase, PMCA-type [Bacteroidales bacterium]